MEAMQLFEENLFSYARMLGTNFGGGKLTDTSGSLASASGLPYDSENYLLLLPSASPFAAEQLIAFFQARSLPFIAPVLPGTPPRLLKVLDDAKVLPALTFTAMSIRPEAAGGAGRLLRVGAEAEAETWAHVVWHGFDSGGVTSPEYLALARHMAETPRNELYLLYDGDTPVSSALLHFTERSCGLYYFATPPEFRRRGHARRLMRALLGAAAGRYGELVLLATPEGLPFYLDFGFRALAEIPIRALGHQSA